MKKSELGVLAVLAASAIAPAVAQTAAQPAAELPTPAESRPANWAEPIALEGVPNLHRITASLYRSEQPTALGMKNLEKLGIRTVINLRFFNSDEDEVKGTSLRTERTRILTWSIGDKHVVEVMKMLEKAENGPFLIHCQHGADRTGLMTAMYRILEQGWSPDEALKELTDGGFGYHSMWSNIIRYVKAADVSALRAAIASSAD
jgi:protein tyrosine/serine phosphatase